MPSCTGRWSWCCWPSLGAGSAARSACDQGSVDSVSTARVYVCHSTYPVVTDILDRVLGAASRSSGGGVNVPELDPPIEQEGVVGDLALGQCRQGHVIGHIDIAGAIGLGVGAGLLRRQLQVAIKHGARKGVLSVPQEVVVDVRIELFNRVVGAHAFGLRHVAHDGGAVDGAVRIHLRHLRHLLVLHRDARC